MYYRDIMNPLAKTVFVDETRLEFIKFRRHANMYRRFIPVSLIWDKKIASRACMFFRMCDVGSIYEQLNHHRCDLALLTVNW